MRATANRRFHGVATREEMFNKVLLSRYMTLLPTECYNCISAKQPKTAEEAAEMVTDYESRESFSKTYLAGDVSGTQNPKREQCVFYNHLERGDSSNEIVSSSSNGSDPPGFERQIVGQNYYGEKGSRLVKLEEKERKPTVCYGCGELGHIRPNCPHKVDRVRTVVCEGSSGSGVFVDGFLAGIEAKGLRVDTGSSRTLVHPDFVPREAYTGRKIIWILGVVVSLLNIGLLRLLYRLEM